MEEKIVCALVAIFAASFLFLFFSSHPKTEIIYYNQTISPKSFELREVEIKVPAVARMDGEEKGVITTLRVVVIPGKGRTLTNIENLLFWIDTQNSIRKAKKVAEEVSGMDLSNVDIIYTLETNASLVGGESAGAALTIATIAALENKTINESVIITGTIEEDGSIGKVGGIILKGEAAKESGASLFLVPKGQGKVESYKPVTKCEKRAFMTFCITNYELQQVNVGEKIGIEVREVSNIQEALKYFLV